VEIHNSCETVADRYKSFDELTSRLGEGYRATEGLDGWKKEVFAFAICKSISFMIIIFKGVPGLRPIMIEFFTSIQKMSEGRLLMNELIDPDKKTLNTVNKVDVNIGRWSFFWQGHDLVLKVLHWF
jgi:hypothetical protein